MSRHLALPLRLGAGGSFVTVDEDSIDEVTQNVRVALLTRPGERLATPELGTDDLTFVGLAGTDVLEQTLEIEPRADLDLVEQLIDELAGEERNTVHVRLSEGAF